MATKKRKRFNEGGSTEAQDKAAGLEASKDERVGFAGLGRFFMGSIDDPKSEAYRRFGAGRGRAEKVPVEDRVAVPVTKAAPETPKVEMDELEAANQREPIPVPAGPRADIRPGGRPSVSVASSAKPAASKPTAPASTRPSASGTYRADSGPGKLASRADTQSYTRKMGAAADRTAPATVTDTGSDMSRMLARAPAPAKAAPAKAAPAKAAPAEKKSSYETPYDRMNRQNREAESSRRSAADAERATLRKNIRERNTGRVDPNTLLPESAMKKGGSVKGWGMARGARKAKIV